MVKMSVIALYNYDNNLFTDLSIPDALDKPSMVDLILTECADFNVLYPDPDFFKARLATWSTRKLPIWTKLYQTTQYTYDPIANYDRTETHTETVTHTGTDANSTSNTASHTGTVQTIDTNTSTESKASYDSATLATTGQIGNSGNSTDTNNLTDTASGYSTRTLNLADSVNRSIRAVGNIGVTTTQQMIEQERDIDKFDIYDIILNDFIDAFCVQVY